MRIETTETSVKLIEHYKERGQWAVRWDFKKKPNEEGVYWYEEEVFNFVQTTLGSLHEFTEMVVKIIHTLQQVHENGS